MTSEDFYKYIAELEEGHNEITLSPGPFSLKVGQGDVTAAKLLLWLYEEMPENATVGDLLDALQSALWWATFWLSLKN